LNGVGLVSVTKLALNSGNIAGFSNYRVSSIEYPVSSNEHPATSIQQPVTSNQ
jgi:hypothetical protein